MEKLLLIGVIALFLIGPDRLPGYSAQFGRLIRRLRDMASGAKDRMRDELGPDYDDMDWKKLDPRQYDPRPIGTSPMSCPVTDWVINASNSSIATLGVANEAGLSRPVWAISARDQ